MTFAPTSGAVITEITALGPFFALHTHAVDARPVEPWVPMSRQLIEARVSAVRGWLATAGEQPLDAVEVRVAASVTHLGLTARLLSPALAAFVLHERLLTFGLSDAHWQPVLGGPIPLSVPSTAVSAGPVPPEALATFLDGPIGELATAMRPFSLSPHILRGNIASALNGAATMIATAAPELAERTRTTLTLLLDSPALRDSATTTANGAFRRRSCCLIYRAAPGHKGSLCGDCVLNRDAGRARNR
ncbi:(2Fe-2S)-binding protein [Streptomyces sp. NBC_00212]|uniref:(2Fe-2S)-binding protein n=1 Tax=Streptomyces sp. NBC_00212 TaxID=2975684 RepID=UPI00324AAE4F